jgi:hypothetical protein
VVVVLVVVLDVEEMLDEFGMMELVVVLVLAVLLHLLRLKVADNRDEESMEMVDGNLVVEQVEMGRKVVCSVLMDEELVVAVQVVVVALVLLDLVRDLLFLILH